MDRKNSPAIFIDDIGSYTLCKTCGCKIPVMKGYGIYDQCLECSDKAEALSKTALKR